MDSINQNQVEDNYNDLQSQQAIDKIKHMVDHAETCFFCTNVILGNIVSGNAADIASSAGTRPMSVQQVDEDGNLWFLSAEDSHKNLEIARDPAVKLYFQGSKHSDFLYLEGMATISKDKEKIKELWEFVINTWFTEGVDDPRITVIKVKPRAGYYWDTKHGNAVAGIKMLFGALTNQTLDDSVEGKLEI